MCKKLVYLLSFVCLLVWCTLGYGGTEVAHWRLDNDATDSVGNIDGVLMNGAGFTTDAMVGSHALVLDPSQSQFVDFGNPPELPAGRSERTLCGWAKTSSVADGWRWIAAYGSAGTSLAMFIGMTGTALYGGGYGDDILESDFWEVGVWHHICLTYDGTTARLYGDGQELASAAKTWNLTRSRAHIGQQVNDAAEFWDGAIDDVRIYSRALTPSQVSDLYNGIAIDFKKAWEPDPPDGAVSAAMPLFQWKAGDDAVFHDVYLGTNPAPGPAELKGRQAFPMYYHVSGLVPGTIYYWRIDEVADDGTVLRTGDVWSVIAAPLTAYQPDPVDGAAYVPIDSVATWSPGVTGVSHDVYFGTDAAAVAAGSAETFQGTLDSATYDPGILAEGTTYYWRVDEIESGGTIHTGDLWSFTTIPVVAISDPNLVCWWKLDEGEGAVVVDWSGHGIHGSLNGDPQWVSGYDGGALELDGDDDYVDFGNPPDLPSGTSARSICGWGRTDTVGTGYRWIAACGSPVTSQALFIGMYGATLVAGGYGGDDVSLDGFWERGEWRHICLTYDGATARLYADGVEVASAPKDWNLVRSRAHIGRQVNTAAEFWDGLVDDVRIYNKALTQEEIGQAMRGDPMLAWGPYPSDTAIMDIRSATPLTWSAGDEATQHDVYFGTDADMVRDADAADMSGIYRARQASANYTPAEDVEWGKTYYWRIDEIMPDGAISSGRLWSFTVADYLIVDDFESYTDDMDAGEAVFQTWIDGWENGTGSVVGYWEAIGGTFGETQIVHGGKQSMPLEYNNVDSPYYSEAERTWATPQNWTVYDVNTLTLHFRGNPVTFMQTGPGSISMSGAGADIYMTTDEFRFAYKRLNGNGSITAKIESIQNTDVWAKAGVMIRASLDPAVVAADMVGTPSDQIEWMYREMTAGATVGISTTAGTTPMPYWVRITRQGNTFTGEHSADGVTWERITTVDATSSVDLTMPTNVYIGLAVTSHAPGVPALAEFSNVETAGDVTGSWQIAEIGVDHPGNDPDQLYVAVEDGAGHVYLEVDPNAVLTTEWTEWSIPLSRLTAAGVNVAAVTKMSIGVGDRSNPQPSGAGLVYIDDIWISKPAAPAVPGNAETK